MSAEGKKREPRPTVAPSASPSATRSFWAGPSPSIRMILDGELDMSTGLHRTLGDPVEAEQTVYDQLSAAGVEVARPEPPEGLGDRRVGRYRGAVEVARGGMGAIYLAFDPNTNRRVALKRLLDLRQQHAATAAKFVAEAQITAQLEHPNIIPIHEVRSDRQGRPYFAMKYVEGHTLQERCADWHLEPETAYTLAARLRIFSRICDAVAFAHSRGVLHRDLKPENVMLGAFGEVLVMDWGLAKVIGASEQVEAVEVELDDESVEATRTLKGTVIGTPSYMPPEQARSELEKIDQRSDVYSLGALLYELLTFTPPFSGNVVTVLAAVARGHLEPPSERAPDRDIPRELEAVVMKAMAPRRQQRYRTVERLKADIEAYLEGRMLAAADYTTLQRWGKTLRRNKLALAGCLLAALAVAALIGWRRIEAVQSADRARQAAEQLYSEAAAAHDRGDRVVSLEKYLEAASRLDAALRELPAHEEARQLRRQIGMELGGLALAGGDYVLADRVYAELAEVGLPDERVEALRAGVREAAQRLARDQAEQLERVIEQANQGLAAGYELDDLVAEALALPEALVVERLGKELQGLLEPIERARRDQEASEHPLSEAERRMATLVCRVLGRLEDPRPARLLVRWLRALRYGLVNERALIEEAALALCRSGRGEAVEPLLALRDELGADDPSWRRVREAFRQLPLPEHLARSHLGPASVAKRGMVLYERGDLSAAIDSLGTALAARTLRPEMRATWLRWRGDALRRRGDHEQALADYGQAMELTGGELRHEDAWAAAALARARLYRALGKLDEAMADLDELLRRRDQLAAFRERALIWLARGQAAKALDDVGRVRPAAGAGPEGASVALQAALLESEAQELAGQAAESLTALRKAWQRWQALEQRRAGAGEAALAAIDRRGALGPRLVLALLRAGDALRGGGFPAREPVDLRATACYREALAVSLAVVARAPVADDGVDADAARERMALARGLLAGALVGLGDHAAADTEAGRGLALVSDQAECLLQRLRSRIGAGQLAWARQAARALTPEVRERLAPASRLQLQAALAWLAKQGD